MTRDSLSSDFALGASLSPDTFWLQQQLTSASRADISFTINLNNIPGLTKVTTTPQDMPVVCP